MVKKKVKKKASKKAKKAKKAKRTKKDDLCQVCRKRPQAKPFIYLDDRVDGEVITRFLCFECSVHTALENIE